MTKNFKTLKRVIASIFVFSATLNAQGTIEDKISIDISSITTCTDKITLAITRDDNVEVAECSIEGLEQLTRESLAEITTLESNVKNLEENIKTILNEKNSNGTEFIQLSLKELDELRNASLASAALSATATAALARAYGSLANFKFWHPTKFKLVGTATIASFVTLFFSMSESPNEFYVVKRIEMEKFQNLINGYTKEISAKEHILKTTEDFLIKLYAAKRNK